MVDKFEIYDIVGILVPGVLVVAAVPLAFPAVAAQAAAAEFPEGFGLLALTALSVFVGYLIQALTSLIEPTLYRTWGGRSSEIALTKGLGDRYLPLDTGTRIRAKLLAVTSPDASDRSLFFYAMQLAESCETSRVRQFNALFAYHRALIVLTLVAIIFYYASFRGGFAAGLTRTQNIFVSLLLATLLLLFWYRTKQRGFYYVREVLLCAERQLAGSTTKGAARTGSHG